MTNDAFTWSSLRGVGSDVAAIISSIPDFCLSLAFLGTWIWPYWFGQRAVSVLVAVVLLEFIVMHSSVFTGIFIISDLPRVTKGLVLIGISLFYMIFAVAFSAAFHSWWPFTAFCGLSLNRLLGAVFGQAPTGREKGLLGLTWLSAALSYLLLALLTVALPLPALGLTPEVIDAQAFSGSGEWIDEPQHAMAFGFLYYMVQGLVSLYANNILDWSARTGVGPPTPPALT